jgi:hypothetical protein
MSRHAVAAWSRVPSALLVGLGAIWICLWAMDVYVVLASGEDGVDSVWSKKKLLGVLVALVSIGMGVLIFFLTRKRSSHSKHRRHHSRRPSGANGPEAEAHSPSPIEASSSDKPVVEGQSPPDAAAGTVPRMKKVKVRIKERIKERKRE